MIEWVERVSTPRAKRTSQSKHFARDTSQFRRTEIGNQSARQVASVEVIKAKPRPGQSPTQSQWTRHLPRVRVVSIIESSSENGIGAVQGALIGVRTVGRGFEHCIVPALVEEDLSDMHYGTRVRDERAEVKG